MTYEKVLKSDEYIQVNIESIVVSKKTIKKIREELLDFMKNYRNELLKK